MTSEYDIFLRKKRESSVEPDSLFYGTPTWTRTKDPLIKSQPLYQLSYRRIRTFICSEKR
jgi:hypothetical protein